MVGFSTCPREQTNQGQVFEGFASSRVAAAFPALLAFASGVRSPQSEVVSEKLHDERAVFVAVLIQGVQLGDCVVKRLLSKLAGFVRARHDLVVKYGEVQGKSKPDWMGGLHG